MSADTLREQIAEAIASGRAGAARVNEKHRLVADRVLAVLGEVTVTEEWAARRGDARKRLAEEAAASPISMHSDAHNELTEAERDALREAVDHDETCPASGEDNDTHGVFAAVARIKAEAVQAERERIEQVIAKHETKPEVSERDELARVLHQGTCKGQLFAHNASVTRCERAADAILAHGWRKR